MFDRVHHQHIAAVLQALNADLLAQHACLFGGGTAIALSYGEYRESVDIDFLVSDTAGYRELRQRLTGPEGLQAIARSGESLHAVRELRADQYGIRTIVQIDGAPIKFEIVLEARLSLDAPTASDRICGVATLSRIDRVASKLLANSDRWADDSVFSRDVIDLAMIQPKGKLREQALAKARLAYGDSIDADLAKAVDALLTREGRLERCMAAMQIGLPKALLWQRLQALAPRKSRGKSTG